ncbi:MAG TPA: hypothetical protein V6D22_10100 [Candidatus Obscuribacterales bacterium]
MAWLLAAQAPVFAEDGADQQCLPPSLETHATAKVPLLKAVIVEQQDAWQAKPKQPGAATQQIKLPQFSLPSRSKSSQRPHPAAAQFKSAGSGSAPSDTQRAAQIKEMNSLLQKYQNAGQAGHRRPLMPHLATAPQLKSAGSAQSDQLQRAEQIKQMTAMLQKYQHAGDAGYHPPHMLSLAPPILPAAAAPSLPIRLQAAARVNNQAPKAAQKPAAKLPRWGDKDCLCHAGLRLFQEKRYLEAADAYRKAGDNMLKAWGRQTNDVANAVRGEGICYSAAGRGQEAKVFLRSAAEMYIRCSNGHPPAELETTILDLSQTYRNIGALNTSNALEADAAKICLLSRLNPPQAIAELDRLACY